MFHVEQLQTNDVKPIKELLKKNQKHPRHQLLPLTSEIFYFNLSLPKLFN